MPRVIKTDVHNVDFTIFSYKMVSTNSSFAYFNVIDKGYYLRICVFNLRSHKCIMRFKT